MSAAISGVTQWESWTR